MIFIIGNYDVASLYYDIVMVCTFKALTQNSNIALVCVKHLSIAFDADMIM